MLYENNWSDDGLYRKFSGAVRTYHILKSNLELHDDHRFPGINYIINDFTAIDEVLIDESNVNYIATVDAMRSDKNSGLKVALLIANNDIQRALAENFCSLMEQSSYICRTFLSLDEATDWASSI